MSCFQYIEKNDKDVFQFLKKTLHNKYFLTEREALKIDSDYWNIFLLQSKRLSELPKETLNSYHLYSVTSSNIRKKINHYIRIGNLLRDDEVNFKDDEILKKLKIRVFDDNFLSELHQLNHILYSYKFEWLFSLLDNSEYKDYRIQLEKRLKEILNNEDMSSPPINEVESSPPINEVENIKEKLFATIKYYKIEIKDEWKLEYLEDDYPTFIFYDENFITKMEFQYLGDKFKIIEYQ